MSDKKLIIFAPHPDDETLGPGGMLAKRIAEGYAPLIVLVTDGCGLFTHHGISSNPTPQQVADARLDETIKALEILGCDRSAIVSFGIQNGELEQEQERAQQLIENVLREQQPDEIYFTNKHEGHLEHRLTNTLVHAACDKVGYAGPRYQYIVNLHRDIDLDTLADECISVDVSAYQEQKRQAVNCFRYHLDKISPEQDKPFVDSFDGYAQSQEIFFI